MAYFQVLAAVLKYLLIEKNLYSHTFQQHWLEDRFQMR